MELHRTWAPLPSTSRSQSVKLSVDPHCERIAYCSNKNVYIRSIGNPSNCVQYNGHIADVTVARFSPSGYYVASGDSSGNVQVWDCKGEDFLLKSEIKALSGRINDIAWDSESKRIIAVGSGREKLGHCFSFDTGNTVGEISGHSATINTVSIRPVRPFRVVTAGDDNALVFHTAFPCKFTKTIRCHKGFVHSVAYAPNGGIFASAGGSGEVFLWDGQTAEKIAPLEAHRGSVLAVCFDSTSKRLLTSSTDRTTLLWDIDSKTVLQKWEFGVTPNPDYQQLGNAYDECPISVSLLGEISTLNEQGTNGGFTNIVTGHQKAITSIINANGTVFTGSYDGRMCSWKDEVAHILPNGHTNAVVNFAAGNGCHLYSIGKDDMLLTVDTNNRTFIGSPCSLNGQPRCISGLSNGVLVLIFERSVELLKDGIKVDSIETSYEATSCASNDELFAVGSADNSVHLYSHKLEEDFCFSNNRASITALAFYNTYLAAGDAGGKVVLYDCSKYEIVTTRWCFQSGRVNSVAWNPDGVHLASASLDTSIAVYSVNRPMKYKLRKSAHREGVNGVQWLDESRLVSAGADAAVKVWKLISDR